MNDLRKYLRSVVITQRFVCALGVVLYILLYIHVCIYVYKWIQLISISIPTLSHATSFCLDIFAFASCLRT